MHIKLKKHFARDACDHAMKKLSDLFAVSAGGDFNIEDTMREIAEEAEHDAAKQNQMTGLAKFKKRALDNGDE